jgi:hypothetical protein
MIGAAILATVKENKWYRGYGSGYGSYSGYGGYGYGYGYNNKSPCASFYFLSVLVLIYPV